ncbi:MAG: hypothetical protein ERJ68_00035 [Aphanocapsa feldmannii 277cI]|uniref:Phage late control D family protein n=1 Tax=Aphanocapsa feldmannii 277cI TaxID=2507554 RepID=A0A524RW11_9CHRO|nr:MAG: hypothetical protein ERJ68_00035 [Aphanocapsa feldmannii 277cI]
MSVPIYQLLVLPPGGTGRDRVLEDITDLISERLISLSIQDEAGQESDSLSLVLDDRDQQLPIPRDGTILIPRLGYRGQSLVEMGRFLVAEKSIRGPRRQLSISCTSATDEDGDAPGERLLLKDARSQSWHRTTLGEIVDTIAERHGLTAVADPDLAGQVIEHVDQTDESDQAFLTRLADLYGAVIKPADGRLTLMIRGAAQIGPVVHLSASDLTSWSARFQDRPRYSRVRVHYSNRIAGGEGFTTVHSPEQGFAEFVLPELFPTLADAEAAGRAKLRSLNTSQLRVTLKGPGHPHLAAEGTVRLSGVHRLIDGEPLSIRSVRHQLGSSGYTTSIECGSRAEDTGAEEGVEGAT